ASALDLAPEVSTTATADSPAGEYPITTSGGAAANYHFTYLGAVLEIGKAVQTIAFDQDFNGTVFGQEPIDLNATASSGLAVYYHSSNPDIAEVNATMLIILGAGEVVLTAHQEGNENFLLAEPVERNFEIKDVTPPVISLIGPTVVYHEAATPYEDESAEAMDTLEGDLTEFIEANSTVNVDAPGSYQVAFNLTDSHDNEALTVIRVVIVEDTTPPSLTVLGGESLPINQLATDAWIEGDHVDEDDNATEQTAGGSTAMVLELSFIIPLRANGLSLPDEFPLDAIERIEALGLDHEESLIVWENQSDSQTDGNGSEGQEEPTDSPDDEDQTEEALQEPLPGDEPQEGELSEEYEVVDENMTTGQEDEQLEDSAEEEPDEQGQEQETSGEGTFDSIDEESIPDGDDNSSTEYTEAGAPEDAEEGTGESSEELGEDPNDQQDDDFIDPDEVFEPVPEPNLVWEPAPFATNHLHVTLKPGTTISDELEVSDFKVFGTLENAVVLEAGEAYEDPGFHAEDTVDGNLTGQVETFHELNVLVPGAYNVVYQVKDEAGNLTQAGRMVHVVDRSAPVLTVLGEEEIEVAAGHDYEDEGAWAVDVVDGNLSAVIFADNPVNVELPGAYDVTYVVSDSRGNSAEIIRAVVVKDWDPDELDILLSGDFVTENALLGELVGEFTAVKPGDELPHQFHLVEGESAEDNALFSIVDGQLRVAGLIDFEENPELAIRIESVSSNGARFEKTFSIKVGDTQVPSVATGESSAVGETIADLSGSLLADGGNPILRIGFELSETPFGEDENETIVFVSVDHADELFAHLEDILPETDYHFRAVVENAEGVAHGESATFRTENASALYGAIEIEGKRNWLASDWFGEIYRTETPWIYHSQLGWLYMVSEDQYSIWLWSNDLGWVWTTADTYPYLYRYSDGAWLNFAFFTDTRRIFYNYLIEGWELYDSD
ncbi:MAG: immunoglobulin-like domain-containing protein, partial [Opitutales bacterium]